METFRLFQVRTRGQIPRNRNSRWFSMGFLHTFNTTFGVGTGMPVRPAWGVRQYKRLSAACGLTLIMCFALIAWLWVQGRSDQWGWLVIAAGLLAFVTRYGASMAARGDRPGHRSMRGGPMVHRKFAKGSGQLSSGSATD